MVKRQAAPWFADGGDSNPNARMADLEAYAAAFFRANRLSVTGSFTPDELADFRRDIVLHCVRDSFRVLKSFVAADASFDAWFCTVCINKAKDYLKSRARFERVITLQDTDMIGNAHDPSPARSPEEEARLRRVLDQVNEAIGRLDRYCRLLIRMEGEEFRPREMVRVLRWPESKAKKVSNDLAKCRERLKNLLAEKGIVNFSS